MLNEPDLERYDLSPLRLVVSGGASCPVETIREYRKKMQGHFIELYGMLESGFHTYTRPEDDAEAVNGTVGKPAPGLGLRILDANGNDVPAGAEGEIAGRGPSIHLGYHNNPAANAAAFTADGWYRTGDLGYFDPEGNVVISGRSKEIINRGGKKFHPREIEEILYTSPSVQHAAIVGVPDPRLGERNCLCVVPAAGKIGCARRHAGAVARQGGKLQTSGIAGNFRYVAVHAHRQSCSATNWWSGSRTGRRTERGRRARQARPNRGETNLAHRRSADPAVADAGIQGGRALAQGNQQRLAGRRRQTPVPPGLR